MDFYPFGLQQQGEGVFGPVVESSNRFKYNGKELDEDVGLYDYGARWFDPASARWGQVDPLSEAYMPLTPYNYVANNPIAFIDPDGMSIKESLGGTVFTGEDAQRAFEMLQNNLNVRVNENPIISGIKKAFNMANEELTRLGIDQSIIDASSKAFDEMIDNFLRGNAQMSAELQITFGLRVAKTFRVKTVLPLVSFGKASFDLNLGSIEFWTGKYTADVNVNIADQSIVRINKGDLSFTGITTGKTVDFTFGARVAASLMFVAGVGGEVYHNAPPSGFQDATTTVSVGSLDYSVNRKTRRVTISSNFQADFRYGAGLVGSAKATLQYSGSVGF